MKSRRRTRRKLRLYWTCSEFAKHRHRYRWIAVLCGWLQKKGFY